MVLVLGAVVCGADNWVEIADFCDTKSDWLWQCLSLPKGMPPKDTFGQVFSWLDPGQLQARFPGWASLVS